MGNIFIDEREPEEIKALAPFEIIRLGPESKYEILFPHNKDVCMEEAMNETIVTDRHLVAELSDNEYIRLRVDVARTGVKLKQWVGQAIREKLDGENKEELADNNNG